MERQRSTGCRKTQSLFATTYYAVRSRLRCIHVWKVDSLVGFSASLWDSPRVCGTPGNGSGSPGKTSGVQALCSFPSSKKNPAHMRSGSQDVSKQIVRQKAPVLCGCSCVIMWPPNLKLLVNRNPFYATFAFSHLPAQK